ncbi:MAG: hypothetical protein U1E73_13245 [Planctomycetota bacterium]
MYKKTTNDPGNPDPEWQARNARLSEEHCRQCIETLGLPTAYVKEGDYAPSIQRAVWRADRLFGHVREPSPEEMLARGIYAAREFVRIESWRNRRLTRWARSIVSPERREVICEGLCRYLLASDDEDPALIFDPATWAMRDGLRADPEGWLVLFYAGFFLRRQNRALRQRAQRRAGSPAT